MGDSVKITKIENKEFATPFWGVSQTYCAKCSRRKNWKPVEVWGFLKDEITMYGFRCHGEEIEIDCDSFIKNNRINGPLSRSFVAFEQLTEYNGFLTEV